MEIKVLASSSSGNCYRISDGHTALLLECGIPIKKIKEGLDFRLSEIDGCLVTHSHKDHSKAAGDVLKAGVPVHMSQGTKDALGLDGYGIKAVKALEQFRVGTFTVLPFDTQHDAKEPLGFLVQSRETGEKLLFLTDSFYCKYRFAGLSMIMIECNYASDILQVNIAAGTVSETLKNRLLQSHFSLGNVKKFLQANDLSKVQAIYLMHLSAGNSDAERFKREIQELTGRQVIVCQE